MRAARPMTLICSLITVLASCGVDGSDLAESSTPAAPAGERPMKPGDCRTLDDCSAFEQCVMGQGRHPVCVSVDEPSSIPSRGPKGQPPPPLGLFEGPAGFAGRSAGASP